MESGLTEQMLALQQGDHLCLFYEKDPAEQMPALLPFIQEGLLRNEQFIYIADDQTVNELAGRLEASGVNVGAEFDRGALKLWTRNEWRQAGDLVSRKKARQVQKFIDDASASGFKGVRFAVEMTWTLGPDISADQLEHWEATINTIFVPGFAGRIVCQYNRSRLAPDVILAALHTHPYAVLGAEVFPNLFYQGPLILNGGTNANGHSNGNGSNGNANGSSNGNGHSNGAAKVEWMLSQLKRARIAEQAREAMIKQRAALDEAERARKQIESVLDSITDGFIALDSDWRFTYLNKAAEALLRKPAAELLGKDYWSVYPGTVGTAFEREFKRAASEQVTVEFEEVHPERQRWFAIKAYPGGSGISVYFRDISEKKRAEETLRQVKAELEVQVDDLHQLHALSYRLVTAADLQSILQEVLRTVLAVFGTDKGLLSLCDPDLDGLRVRVSNGFTDEFLERVEFVPAGVGACGLCFKKRERVVVEDTETDPLFAALRDAARLAGFRAVHNTPLITHSGKIIGVLSVHFPNPRRPSERETQLVDLYARQAADAIESARLRDLAARELAQRERAEEASRRLAAIVESSDDAIVSKDLCGIVTSWNKGAEQLYGYTADEVIGKSITIVMPLERRNEPSDILERIRQGQRVEHFETVRRCKDGTLVDISLTVSPVKDRQGRVVGASKIARNISERKRVERALTEAKEQLARANAELEKRIEERTAELVETNSQLEAFVYSIAHDLRAPLRSMQAFSSLLLEEYASHMDETGQLYARRIAASAERMDVLVLDLLAYGRIARSEISLASVLVESAWLSAMMQNDEAIRETRAHIEAVAPLPAVRAHETTLTQVLANILSNAIKFMAPGVSPRVRLWVEPRPELIRLWIEDNGIGIAPEHHDRIFRVFERLHGQAYPGTGIGLSIVRKGVERMGGRVGLESKPGAGSRFWIELPKA